MNSLSNIDSINLDSLDDWLENDLVQSGVVLSKEKPLTTATTPTPAALTTPAQVMMASPPISECTPRMDPLLDIATPLMKYEPLSPIETPKIEPQDMPNTTTTHKPVIDIQPFIKALSLLNSIHNTNNINSNKTDATTSLNQHNKRERSDSIDTYSNSNNNNSNQQQDLVALKRQRNTDAARRSRQRKAMKMESLEKRVMDLEAENDRLRLRAAVAESERANIEAKEKRSRVRILELERQLADTHKALLRYNQKEASSTSMTVKV